MNCMRCKTRPVENDIFCRRCFKKARRSPTVKKELAKIRSVNKLKLSKYRKELLSRTVLSQNKALSIVRKIASRFNIKVKSEKAICNYIIDIFIDKYKIGIEIDGSSHKNKMGYDDARDNILKENGISIYRFDNNEIDLEYFKKAIWGIFMDEHLKQTKNLLKIARWKFDYIPNQSWVALFY